MIRVALVEDQRLVCRVLTLYVNSQSDMEVIGEAHDGREGVELCKEKSPDVVLMDISMPVMDGLAATHEINTLLPDVAVLILTAYVDYGNVSRGLEAGARGYLHKNCGPDELADAIRAVHAGELVLSADLAKMAPSAFQSAANANECSALGLTRREVEILRALAGNRSTRQIAQTLHISERTVRNHAYNIYKKLHVRDRSQAVLHALRHGLIDLKTLGES